jgi:hypothetical protein
VVTKGAVLRIANCRVGLPPLELPSATATLTLTPVGAGERGVLMFAGRETLRWTHVGLVSPKEWTGLGIEERGFGKGVVVEFGATAAVTVGFARGSAPDGTLADWRARLPTNTVCTVEARAVGWEAMPVGLMRGLAR